MQRAARSSRFTRQAFAVALLATACVPDTTCSPYHKHLAPVSVAEPIGHVGTVELAIEASFTYGRHASGGRIGTIYAVYRGGVWLRPEGAPTYCVGPSLKTPEWRRSCEVTFWKFEDEASWRAAQADVELESCAAGTRAAMRATVAGETFPADGWVLVEVQPARILWTPWAMTGACEDALAVPWPEPAAIAP